MKIQSGDIFIDIIDNYGDMGWILEFLMMNRLPIFWNIVTNAPVKMESFLEKSGCSLPPFIIIEKEKYDLKKCSNLVILWLHTNINFRDIPAWRSVIRINYLSFDPWYQKIHNTEHILSSSERPIRELSYSPLCGMGGIWEYKGITRHRENWLSDIHLPWDLSLKIWIPIFCYEETLTHFDMRNIPENVLIFLIGNPLRESHLQENILYFPWMKRDDFWDLIDLADISVLRGEITSARGLRSKKTFLWDMYKEIGWWNKNESDLFLDFIKGDRSYREVHTNINTWKPWNIQNILSLHEKKYSFLFEEIPDFQKTLKNTLDSFGFSL